MGWEHSNNQSQETNPSQATVILKDDKMETETTLYQTKMGLLNLEDKQKYHHPTTITNGGGNTDKIHAKMAKS